MLNLNYRFSTKEEAWIHAKYYSDITGNDYITFPESSEWIVYRMPNVGDPISYEYEGVIYDDGYINKISPEYQTITSSKSGNRYIRVFTKSMESKRKERIYYNVSGDLMCRFI